MGINTIYQSRQTQKYQYIYQNQLKETVRKMIQERLKVQGSMILSPKDVSKYFQSDKFNRNSFCGSSHTSPDHTSLKDNQQDSENQTTSQNHQQEIQRLSNIIKLQRNRNQTLNQELSTLTNSLHIQNTMTQELQAQKQKLIQQLHYIRKSYENVQHEKNKYYNEAIALRNENNRMRGLLEINEEQISTLENTNRNMIDELNFQKQMCADYKIQNTMFKGQLKNIEDTFVRLREWIEEQKSKIGKQVSEVLCGQVQILKEKFTELKEQFKGAATEQKELIEHKNYIFGIVRKIELSYQSTRTQLNIAKSLSQSFQQPSSSVFLVRQSQFRKTIESQQQTIKSLTTEVTGLKSQILSLQDQIKQSSHVQLLAPRFHTNTGYVNKLVKENHREIMQIKQLIESKDEQIQRIRQQLQLQKSTSIIKTQQIQRLSIILKMQQNNKYEQFSNEIQQLKGQKVRLNRRIQQLNQKLSQTKSQNIEKDRIIMNYVNKNKSQ